MGASSTKRSVKREVRPNLDLPWILQTSGIGGSDSAPGTPLAPIASAMAGKSDEVFENACYVFVVFGASVSCLLLLLF